MSISLMSGKNAKRSTRPPPEFSFLTNHGKTLLLIAHDPRIRMRDIAGLLNITERSNPANRRRPRQGRVRRTRARGAAQPLHREHPPTARATDAARHRHRIPTRHPSRTERLPVSGARLVAIWLIGLGVSSIVLVAVRADIASVVFPFLLTAAGFLLLARSGRHAARFPSTDLERGLDRLFALLLPRRKATTPATLRIAVAQRIRVAGFRHGARLWAKELQLIRPTAMRCLPSLSAQRADGRTGRPSTRREDDASAQSRADKRWCRPDTPE